MDVESRDAAIAAFHLAHERAGGHTELARVCGCSAPNIFQLVDKRSLLPGRYVLKVEAATGVSRHDLRPDLYPREDTPAPPPASPSRAGGSPLEGVRA
jgi:hypothetical protein